MKGRTATALLVLTLAGCLEGGAGSSHHATDDDAPPPFTGTPNHPVSAAIGTQEWPRIIPDGADGAFIAWTDGRFGFNKIDIYAQRIDGQGAALWDPDGVVVSTAAFDQMNPQLVPDGAGGIIVAWQDNRGASTDIYAQRMDGAGIAAWTTGGVPVCTAFGSQLMPRIAAEAGGGALVAWMDYRSGGSAAIYSQRLDGAGATKWVSDRQVSTGTVAELVEFLPDDSDGGYIAWRQDPGPGDGLYVGRIAGSGTMAWSGIRYSDPLAAVGVSRMVRDGSGGLIAWEAGGDIRIQRFDSTGAAGWTAGGAPVCVDPALQVDPDLAVDGAGGCVLAWSDDRDSARSIYAQRLDASGLPLWTTDGVRIAGGSGARVVAAGAGSSIVAWIAGSPSQPSIFALKLGPDGLSPWTYGPLVVRSGQGGIQPMQMIPDGDGGAMLTWSEFRNYDANSDIYAQPVSASGSP